jgi:hypothetical protein
MACFAAAKFDLDASALDILEGLAVCLCLANSVQYRGRHSRLTEWTVKWHGLSSPSLEQEAGNADV